MSTNCLVPFSCFHPFFFTWSLGKVVLEWFILSWITHKKILFRSDKFCSPYVIKMPTRFLMNVMLIQFHFMFLHIRIIYSCLRYQVFQGFTNSIIHKSRSSCFFTSTLRCFLFFSHLIANCEILPICSSLLIYKSI